MGGSVWAGQISGMITKEQSAKEIVEELMLELSEVLGIQIEGLEAMISQIKNK